MPWVQDFSFSVPYGLDEVRAQIDAARIVRREGLHALERRGPVHGRRARAAAESYGASRSRRQPPSCADVAHAIVETVVAVRPELDVSGTRR